ncbi:hypothetical protein, partial [Actinomadura sp. BRA 177]|uniref:hypothetical protein n=1 Tax=Actinomadura sp. BRA 177 TaxID=2745202 RepID=UPI001C3DD029
MTKQTRRAEQTRLVERTGPAEQTGLIERTGRAKRTGLAKQTRPTEQTGLIKRTWLVGAGAGDYTHLTLPTKRTGEVTWVAVQSHTTKTLEEL